jgi:hypothetical protein
MVISGLVVLGVFVAAGLRYLTSAGNPGAVNESKNRMISAFLGAIIILSSYLILNAVNPQISIIQINDMSPAGGVTFTDADGTTFTTSASVPNLELVGIPTPVSVTFLSSEVEVTPCHTEKDYSAGNCEDYAGYDKIQLGGAPVGSLKTFPSDANAAKLSWKVYGVYAYDKQEYEGDLRIYDGLYATLGDFNDKIRSVTRTALAPIGPTPLLYGAVLHKDEGFKGDCKFFLALDALNTLPSAWDKKISSIETFKYLDGYPYKNGQVNLYPDVDYQGTYEPGFLHLGEWRDLGISSVYSLEIQGDYLVALAKNSASDAGNGDTGRCEVFYTSDSNLNDNYIGQCTKVGTCNPTTGCFAVGSWCPVCTVSCAKSYIVIPIVR